MPSTFEELPASDTGGIFDDLLWKPSLDSRPNRGVIDTATSSLARGTHQLAATGLGLGGVIADTFGADQFAKSFMRGYTRQMAQAADIPAEIGSYTNIRSLSDDPEGFIRDVGTYINEGVFENIPNMAASMGGGEVGAIAGGALAKRGVAKRVAERALGEKFGAAAAERVIGRGRLLGAEAGAFVANTGQEIGSIGGDIYEKTGQISVPESIVGGVAAGAVETLGELGVLKKVFGEAVAGKLNEKLRWKLARIGETAGKQFSKEALTEAIQTGIEEASAYHALNEPDKPFWTPELMDSIIDSALKGGASGAVMGMGAQIVQEARRKEKVNGLRAAADVNRAAGNTATADALQAKADDVEFQPVTLDELKPKPAPGTTVNDQGKTVLVNTETGTTDFPAPQQEPATQSPNASAPTTDASAPDSRKQPAPVADAPLAGESTSPPPAATTTEPTPAAPAPEAVPQEQRPTTHPAVADFDRLLAEQGMTPEEHARGSAISADLVPMPDEFRNRVYSAPSKIAGKGMFASSGVTAGREVAPAMILEPDGIKRTPAGRYVNHADDANTSLVVQGNQAMLVAKRFIPAGEELTVNYREQAAAVDQLRQLLKKVEPLPAQSKDEAGSVNTEPKPDAIQEQIGLLAAWLKARDPEMFTEKGAMVSAGKVVTAASTGTYGDILHPDNKNSRALFEMITGVKLPKSATDTKALFTGKPFPVTMPEQSNPASVESHVAESDQPAKPRDPVAELDNAKKMLASIEAKLASLGRVTDDRLERTARQLRTVIKQLEAEVAATNPAPAPSTAKLDDIKARRAELQRKIREKLKQIGSAPDPELLTLAAQLAANYAEEGVVKFKDFASRVKADMGDVWQQMQRYLHAAWQGAGADNAQLEDVSRKEAADHLAAIDKEGATGNLTTEAQNERPLVQRERSAEAADASSAGSPTEQRGDEPRGRVGGEQSAAGEGVGGERPTAATGDAGPTGGAVGAGEGTDGRPESPERVGDQRPLRGAKPSPPAVENAVLTDADAIGKGGLKTKVQDNFAAIRLLKQLEAEDRPATVDEQRILARYVGWGGLKGAFDPKNKTFTKEFQQLRELLTPEEYEAARRSVLDAHYTSPTIIQRGVYAALKRFGFTGGKMVEGGVGVGHFIGFMPGEWRDKSSYLGIEKDPLTARIAQKLYPKAVIHNMGYEQADLARGTFDASAGNPPFGQQQLFDKNFKDASKHSIHNYFILKTLELLRPGGVAGFVVSHYFLDTLDPAAREAIASKAQFLGAIRLPNTAFKENANTEVTTDLVFFKRLPEGASGTSDWTQTTKLTDKESGKPITVNAWLAAHPDMMLGEMTLGGKMYAGDRQEATLAPHPNQDLGADLDKAVAKLPENQYSPVDASTTERLTTPQPVTVPDGVRVGGFYVENGKLMKRGPDVNMERTALPVELPNEKTGERIKGIIQIRDALNQLIRAELSDDSTPEKLDKLRADLNQTYDRFVKRMGYLNEQANRRAFFDDPESARVLGLEREFDPGVSDAVAKKNNLTARKPSAKKAAIFEKRVNAPYQEVTRVDTPTEALAVSMNQRGGVDVDYMAQITGMDRKAVLDGIEGKVFNTPEGVYQTKEQYLSGNVRQKLQQAEEAFRQTGDPQWQRNVEALKAVIPPDIHPTDIRVPVGAPWVPAKDVAQFAKDLTGSDPRTVVYRKSDAGWLFTHGDTSPQWSTKRATFGDIFSTILNGKPIVIYDRTEDDKRIVNQQETELANAKAEEIKQKWADWIWQDKDRRDRLARLYNDTFNNYVDPHYDGSHLTLPGASPLVELRPHQKNVIWRTLTDMRVLYDHVVGAGKTFAGIAAFMEMKRVGRVRKPLFVVPNHLVVQWRDEFVKLYPNANILYAQPSDFEKDKRQKLFAKMLTGEYDAIIIGHSPFKKIGVSAEIEKGLLNEMLAEITSTIEEMKKAEGRGGRGSRAVANAERTKESIQAKLQKLADGTGKRDSVATFEELGIDGLFVDEAHEFKNLFYTTQMQNVAGLGSPEGSAKAFDLYLKTRYLNQRYGGKAPMVFATGTPISNSLVEMFTMQRYLQPEMLEQAGMKTLDAWARVFADVKGVYEVDPTGTGYRLATRLANFQNVGELASTYRTVADVITMDDLRAQAEAAGKRFPVPKVKGGKPQNMVSDRTPEQAAYFGIETQQTDHNGKPLFDSEGNPVMGYAPGTILYRVDNMPDDPREDNMLKLTNDARKAGLDMRLVNPSAPDRPESKVNKAVAEIVKTYRQWDADKGTQLVFCDLSVPSSARGKATEKAITQQTEHETVKDQPNETESSGTDTSEQGVSVDELLADQSKFSVYDDVKAKLVKAGIPAEQIAFIHDYDTPEKKQKLFAAVNRGDVRVLMGSTPKLGAGTNVQERLVALHHLDAPWRPSDLEQREGRIIRQGNALYQRDPDNFEVAVNRYATALTYDTRMWQLIEHKARGIEGFRLADRSTRTIEDVSGEAANASDMKAAASGDPLIQKEIELRNDRNRLELLKKGWDRNRFEMEHQVPWLKDYDLRYQSAVDAADAKIAQRQEKPDPFKFALPDGKETEDRKDVAKVIVDGIAANKVNDWLGTYRGFKFAWWLDRSGSSPAIRITTIPAGAMQAQTVTNFTLGDEISGTGLIQRLDNYLNGFEQEKDVAAIVRDNQKSQLAEIKSELAKPFPRAEDLASVTQEHNAARQQLMDKKRAKAGAPSTQRAIDYIDTLTAKLNSLTYSDPLMLVPVAKLALKIARAMLKAGYTLETAIREAIRQAKAQMPEDKTDPHALEKSMSDAITAEAPETKPEVRSTGESKVSASMEEFTPETMYRTETEAGRNAAADQFINETHGGDLDKAFAAIAIDAPRGMPDSLRIITAARIAQLAAREFRATGDPHTEQLARKALVIAKQDGSETGQALQAVHQANKQLAADEVFLNYYSANNEAIDRLLSARFPDVVSHNIKAWLAASGREAVKAVADLMTKTNNVTARVLRMVGRDAGVDWASLFTSSALDQKQWQRDLFAKINEHPLLQKLADKEKVELTNLLSEAWQRERMKIFRREFNKNVALPGVKETDKAKLESALPELVKQLNLGLLENEAFRNAVAPRYGERPVTLADARALYDQAQAAQTKPEGFQRDRAFRAIYDEMQRRSGKEAREVLKGWWYASVLSGMGTQGRNIIGNASILAENLAASVLRNPKAAPQLVAAMWRGMRENATQGEFKAIMSGDVTARPGMDIKGGSNALEIAKDSPERWKRLLSNGRYVTRFMLAADSFFYDAAAEVAAVNQIIADNKSASWPAVEAKIFDQLNLSPEKRAAAEAKAKAEGLTGTDLKRRVVEILEQQRPSEILDAQHRFALEATLNNEPQGLLGFTAKSLIAARKKFPPMTAVVPFIRISANVGNMLLQHSPFGLYWVLRNWRTQGQNWEGAQRGSWSGNLIGIKPDITPEEYQQLRAKVLLSHAALVSAFALAASGADDKDPWFQVTGSMEGIDPQKRRQLEQQGIRPYSVKFGDRSFDYRQTPWATGFATVGAWMDGYRYDPKFNDKEFAVRVASSLASGKAVILDQNFLSNLMVLFDRGSQTAKDASAGGALAFLGRTVGGMVPSVAKEIDSMLSPDVRKAQMSWDHFTREFPVIRRDIGTPVVNVLGEPIQRPRYPWSWLTTEASSDPVWQALGEKAQRGVFLPAPSAAATVLENGKRVKMTPEQFAKYQAEVGRLYREKLVRDLSRFQAMTPEQATVYFRREFEPLREQARMAAR
jgi:N12 class adenine-specific DNA methylase